MKPETSIPQDLQNMPSSIEDEKWEDYLLDKEALEHEMRQKQIEQDAAWKIRIWREYPAEFTEILSPVEKEELLNDILLDFTNDTAWSVKPEVVILQEMERKAKEIAQREASDE